MKKKKKPEHLIKAESLPHKQATVKKTAENKAEPFPLFQNTASIRSKHLPSILLILIISIAIYANTLKNGFVYDDKLLTIVNNTLIKDLNNLSRLFIVKDYFLLSGETSYRPVVTLTYFIDYALFELNPWGYHFMNIMLHAANGALLYIFLTQLIKEMEVPVRKSYFANLLANQPLLITLLFVTNPILTEAVNGISYREDLLTFLFYIATLNLYLLLRSIFSYAHKSISFYLIYAVSCLLYFLALLSKEMALTLPLIILYYEWLYRDTEQKRPSSIIFNRYNIGYIAVTFGYVYLRFYHFLNSFDELKATVNITERLLTLPWILLNYIKLIVFPISLSADYEIVPVKSFFSSLFIVPSVMIASILAILVIVTKKEKTIIFGILFFIINLLPVYNIFPIPNPFAERYLYLPAVGFTIIMGIATHLISKNRTELKVPTRAVLILFIIIIGIYSFTTVKRANVWRSDYLLWSDTTIKMPNSSRAHTNLGLAYLEKGTVDKALIEFQEALKINPSNSDAHSNLGILYARQGSIEMAMREFKLAIRLNPNQMNSHYNLGLVYLMMELKGEAKKEFEIALKLKPNDPDVMQEIKSLNAESH